MLCVSAYYYPNVAFLGGRCSWDKRYPYEVNPDLTLSFMTERKVGEYLLSLLLSTYSMMGFNAAPALDSSSSRPPPSLSMLSSLVCACYGYISLTMCRVLGGRMLFSLLCDSIR